MKRLICFLNVFCLLVSICTVFVSAKQAPNFYGDVNNNRNIEIVDATEIQRHLAGMTKLSALSEELADVDADDKVTIMDATTIQRKLAGIIHYFKNEYIYTYVDINNVTVDFNSGKAMVGVPVTFNVTANSFQNDSLRYVLKVNNVVVDENTEHTVTYTFEEAGDYYVEILVYNEYDEVDRCIFDYRVVEKPDEQKLIVSAVNKDYYYFNEDHDIQITAHAFGGVAPYVYSFEMSDHSIKQDYSENSTFSIGKLPIGTYEVNVSAKDAEGNVADLVYTFEVEEFRVK